MFWNFKGIFQCLAWKYVTRKYVRVQNHYGILPAIPSLCVSKCSCLLYWIKLYNSIVPSTVYCQSMSPVISTPANIFLLCLSLLIISWGETSFIEIWICITCPSEACFPAHYGGVNNFMTIYSSSCLGMKIMGIIWAGNLALKSKIVLFILYNYIHTLCIKYDLLCNSIHTYKKHTFLVKYNSYHICNYEKLQFLGS